MKKRILCVTEGALSLALAYVLELLCVWLNTITGVGALLPFGGTITISMLPIIYYSYRRGAAWGIGAGFVYSLLQMLLGFYVPPAGTWWALVLCILLDYTIAFTIVGAAELFAKPFGQKRLVGYCVGAVVVCLIRFVSSFLSGVILWGSYAPEGMNVWIYSLIYNSSYMLPNAVLTGIFAVVVCAALDPKLNLIVNNNISADTFSTNYSKITLFAIYFLSNQSKTQLTVIIKGRIILLLMLNINSKMQFERKNIL